MGSNFIPNYGNESDFSSNIQNGNLYVSEDTKRLFFDLNGKRIKVSDVVFLSEKPLIGISGKLYIIKSDNSLWIFEDTWKQLNSSSSGSVNVDNKTINKNSNDQIQSIGIIDSRSGESVKYWTGTLAQYDAIETKDDNTIYNITDDIIDINQNHFLPAGSILTIEADGSGQFTKLSEAINYLTGKLSNGTVTIQLGEGTFEETESITIDGNKFNISNLEIKGNSSTGTIVSFSNRTVVNLYVINNAFVSIFDMQFSANASSWCIEQNQQSTLFMENCLISNVSGRGIQVISGSRLCISTKITLIGASPKGAIGIACSGGGKATFKGQSNISMSNFTTGLAVGSGGLIALNYCTKTFSNVTNTTSQGIGTANANGLIAGSLT